MKKDKDNNIGLNRIMTNELSSVPSKTIVDVNRSECQNCKKCRCQSQKILENIPLNPKDNLKK